MINLLPQSEKDGVYNTLFKRQIHSFGLVLVVIIFGGSIFILNTFAFLKIQVSGLQNSLATETIRAETKTAQGVEDNVKNLNAELARYKNFRGGSAVITGVLNKLQAITPAGVSLTVLSLDVAAKKIIVSGRAVSRDDVIAMEANLKKSDFFEKVDSPLNNFLEKSDASFSFTFYFK